MTPQAREGRGEAATVFEKLLPRLDLRFHLVESTAWGERAAWEGDDLPTVAANARNLLPCSGPLFIRDTQTGAVLLPHEWPVPSPERAQ